MTREAFKRGDWLSVINGHALESYDPQEWLRYGAALLHTLEPGSEQLKEQQQAALAFVQAGSAGATAEQVAAAQRQVLLRSLQEALVLAGLQAPEPLERPQAAGPGGPDGPPVTLTAISGRLDTLPAVVASLQGQSVRPARLHLHLSRQGHLLDGGIPPEHPLLQELGDNPWVQLHWVPNLGPYRKVVPFLEAGGYGDAPEGDNDLFITVDDDTLYPPRFVEYLLRHHGRHGCIVAHRGRRILLEPEAGFLPYGQWHDGLREPRLANLATGQSGVLYRRSYFPKDLELEAALALAPTHDDLWLRWLTARQGVPAVILQPNAAANTRELAFPSASAVPIEQQDTLWFAYNAPEAQDPSRGGNDAATAAIHTYFRERGFDLEAALRQEMEEQADFY